MFLVHVPGQCLAEVKEIRGAIDFASEESVAIKEPASDKGAVNLGSHYY